MRLVGYDRPPLQVSSIYIPYKDTMTCRNRAWTEPIAASRFWHDSDTLRHLYSGCIRCSTDKCHICWWPTQGRWLLIFRQPSPDTYANNLYMWSGRIPDLDYHGNGNKSITFMYWRSRREGAFFGSVPSQSHWFWLDTGHIGAIWFIARVTGEITIVCTVIA